jgi:hypothetical protein
VAPDSSFTKREKIMVMSVLRLFMFTHVPRRQSGSVVGTV